MKISVCITTLNEERSIGDLLHSLLLGSTKPSEIVIVDAGSKDQTIEIIKHYQKKDSRIKLQVEEGISRSKGRNLSVELAQYGIIAMTDGGCVVQPDWLRNITEPFANEKVDIVAGFYDMVAKTSFQKALTLFMGVLPGHFDANFLPSTRSITFRKDSWEKVGGFPESLEDTAEDTMFNYRAIRQGLKFTRVKSARVEWVIPEDFKSAVKKIYKYAVGDAKTKILVHPVKGFSSHNIKAILKIFRYIFALGIFILSFYSPSFFILFILLFSIYCFWAFRKVYIEFRDWKTGVWGVVLQFASDFAVMAGFLKGITTG